MAFGKSMGIKIVNKCKDLKVMIFWSCYHLSGTAAWKRYNSRNFIRTAGEN